MARSALLSVAIHVLREREGFGEELRGIEQYRPTLGDRYCSQCRRSSRRNHNPPGRGQNAHPDPTARAPGGIKISLKDGDSNNVILKTHIRPTSNIDTHVA